MTRVEKVDSGMPKEKPPGETCEEVMAVLKAAGIDLPDGVCGVGWSDYVLTKSPTEGWGDYILREIKKRDYCGRWYNSWV